MHRLIGLVAVATLAATNGGTREGTDGQGVAQGAALPPAPVTPRSGSDSCREASPGRAGNASGMRDRHEAAAMWESVVLADERVAKHWVAYGHALYEASRYQHAVAAFERAMQLDAGTDATWEIARAYARLGNRKQSLRWLRVALERGDSSPAAVREEPAFERFRDDPVFRELLAPRGSLRATTPRRPARNPAEMVIALR